MTDKIGYTRKGDVAVLRIKNPPVNALSHAVREGLVAGMAQAEADDGVKAVVIVGEGRAFIAGADITEFGKTPLEPFLPDVCKRIEDSPLIVVASMHGVSLGGGLEIALSAHYRVAQPSAKVGLPEVHLGLIPGAGATQRLPRLIGVDPSLDLITSGRQVKAAEAESLGIVDQVTEGDPEDVGVAYAENLIATNAPRRPVSEMAAPAPIDWDAAYDGTLKKGRGQISPAQAVRAVQAAAELPFDEGMLAERKIFMELMETDQRQGMIHAFFSERAVGNLPELKGVEPRALQSIGIIGGGTMGAGIATAALLAGFNVVLIEMKDEAAKAAHERISGNLQGALKRGKIDQGKFDHLTGDALTVSTDYASLSDVDLVVEAVFEDMDVKKQVFGRLDAVCKPGCVLASNTSTLSIDDIAAAIDQIDAGAGGGVGEADLACIIASGVGHGDIALDQHRFADPACRIAQARAGQLLLDRCQIGVHLGDAAGIGDGRHLRHHLGIIDRFERVLILHLRGQQLQEARLIHRRVAGADFRVGIIDRKPRAVGDGGNARHLPILMVSSIRDLAVLSTWTLFWYMRAVSIMSTSSALLSTAASHTSPLASASG